MTAAAHAHRNLGEVPKTRPAARFCHERVAADSIEDAAVTLVSSYAGPLKKLLLTIPNYVVRTKALANVYIALAKTLPSYTHFVILTNQSSRKTVASWFRRARHTGCRECRIVTVGDELAFSMWAEDPYVVGRDESGQGVFVDPFKFNRNADTLISSLVAQEAGLRRLSSPLIFQGGNVLVGDDFYLVGADYLHDSVQAIIDNESIIGRNGKITPRLKRAVRVQFLDSTRMVHFIGCKKPQPAERKARIHVPAGRSVAPSTEHIYQGNRPGTMQPLFHLDMFVTLAGREPDGRFRILVGDPRLAAQTLGMKLPRHALASAFDEIAQTIAAHRRDFVVTRNPLPLVYLDVHSKKGKNRRRRWWYFASANNALVERRPRGRPRVWLPSYGHGAWRNLRATDAMNEAIWKKLGFDVVMLPNCHGFAENLGAVHCIKKYLAR